jgi:predicted ribosomally synthesized peptide with SipW-like signal peptide
MKKSILMVVLGVLISAALVSGATLAWFTATAEPIVNEFTAGTVEISADYTAGFGKIMEENWNPGDCTDLDLEVVNEGTKSVYLRAKIDKVWMPSMLRVLIVYTGTSVQLLAVEWDATCKGFTVSDGPLTEADLYVQYPSLTAYINGIFSNLSDETFLSAGSYNVWCLDQWESITKGVTYRVQIFDPMFNPDWYDEVDSKVIWKDIPIEKIVYIINGDFLNRGYNSDDMQEAIWHYTNALPITRPGTQDIIDETEANWLLPVENVTIQLGDDWVLGSDGYYYYQYPIAGTYTESDLAARTIRFDAKVCLDGELTGNLYQGKVFTMTTYFEAIQSSNGAVDDAWPANPY